jgi:hypothetical protein
MSQIVALTEEMKIHIFWFETFNEERAMGHSRRLENNIDV